MATVTFSAADDLLYAYLAGEIDHDATKNTIDMEGMFSLGNVGLWRMASNGYMSLTGEVGELFITKILGTIILKLKYKDIVYAVSKNANERYFRVPTSEGGYFFYFDSFNELKEAIEKGKQQTDY